MTLQMAKENVMTYLHHDNRIKFFVYWDLPDRYLFSMGHKGNKYPTPDSMFQVDKKTGEVREYQPNTDMENYKKAKPILME